MLFNSFREQVVEMLRHGGQFPVKLKIRCLAVMPASNRDISVTGRSHMDFVKHRGGIVLADGGMSLADCHSS